MEGIDFAVWTFIRDQRDFVHFSGIQKATGIGAQKLTTVLRRLEKAGEVFRDIGFHKQRPVNTYLAIDANSPRFRARIVDDYGWLFVIFEWLDESGGLSRSISTTLGEFADYVRFQRDGQGVLDWPPWVQRLEETGRVSHDKFSWE